jgi:hypothetical protein
MGNRLLLLLLVSELDSQICINVIVQQYIYIDLRI